MRWDYLLFDLDGTLNDSMPGIAKSLVATLTRLGRPAPPWQELRWCIGPPLNRVLERLMPGESPAYISQAIDIYREIYGAGGIFDGALFPGVPSLLNALSQSGVPFYIATSKPWPQARRILDFYRLTSLFTGVYGPELDGTHGEKSALLAHLIATEKLAERRGIMIGDREFDVIAARHNGLFALGVTYGYGTVDELQAAGVQALCSSVEEMERFLFAIDEAAK